MTIDRQAITALGVSVYTCLSAYLARDLWYILPTYISCPFGSSEVTCEYFFLSHWISIYLLTPSNYSKKLL